MTQRHKIQLFEDKKVRTAWDDEREEWYFSIVDVCAVLSESENPQTYWRVLKNRLKKEGNETVTNCNALKMLAPDGKMRLTDVASTEQLFRLIQSIPSRIRIRGGTGTFIHKIFPHISQTIRIGGLREA